MTPSLLEKRYLLQKSSCHVRKRISFADRSAELGSGNALNSSIIDWLDWSSCLYEDAIRLN